MKTVTIEDLKQFVFIENPVYAPDGKSLAFIKATVDEKNNGYHRDLYLVKDGMVRQYTAKENTSFVLWNDETEMIISRKAETPGTTELLKLSVDGGEAIPWMALPFPLVKLHKLDNGNYVVIGSVKADEPDAWKVKAQKKEEDQSSCTVVDELPYWMNGSGYINKDRNCLFVIRDGTVDRITGADWNVDETVVDGNRMYYTCSKKDPSICLYQKLYCYDGNTGEISCIYDAWTHSIQNLYIVNGTLYFQASDMRE